MFSSISSIIALGFLFWGTAVLWPFSYICCFFVVFCTSVDVTVALVFLFIFSTLF